MAALNMLIIMNNRKKMCSVFARAQLCVVFVFVCQSSCAFLNEDRDGELCWGNVVFLG